MKRMTAALLVLLALTFSVQAEIGFSGDVTMVSTYVWRGVTQFNGAAMQGTIEGSYGILAFGMWNSTMQDIATMETDPYIGITLPAGPIEASVGATLYSYDFFTVPGSVYEIYASAGMGPFSAAFYLTPEQDDGNVASVYWLDLAYGASFIGADWSIGFGYGTYSDWTRKPTDFDALTGEATAFVNAEAVGTLTLTASKAITDAFSVSWNYCLPVIDDDEYSDLSNVFFFGASYGF